MPRPAGRTAPRLRERRRTSRPLPTPDPDVSYWCRARARFATKQVASAPHECAEHSSRPRASTHARRRRPWRPSRSANVLQTSRPFAANVLQTLRTRTAPQTPANPAANPSVCGVLRPCLAGCGATSSIGETGFEPATARPPAGCATRLRHSPWPSPILGTSAAKRPAPAPPLRPVRRSCEHMFVSWTCPPQGPVAAAAKPSPSPTSPGAVWPRGSATTTAVLPCGLQAGALRGPSSALYRQRPDPQAGARRGASRAPVRVLRRAPLRRLRRDRSAGPRVRPSC